jgi:hypothetical protein
MWQVGAYPVMTINSDEYQIAVAGGVGPFSIVHAATGAVVHQGVRGAGVAAQIYTLPATTLELGALYYVESGPGSGFLRSGLFRAENVWSRSSVDPRMVASKVDMRTDFPVANTDFISWELHWRFQTPPDFAEVLLTMVVGAWDYGINPTVPALGVEVLAVPYGDLGAQLRAWDNRGRVSFGWAINVNNPALVGLKVAAQALGALPTGQFITSDVVGVQLSQTQ